LATAPRALDFVADRRVDISTGCRVRGPALHAASEQAGDRPVADGLLKGEYVRRTGRAAHKALKCAGICLSLQGSRL
jgi:hypothetical protein